MSEDWSREEVEATVADYSAMLTAEIERRPINKAEHNRHLQRLLPNRTRGAIEFKHANISAALIDLGYPYIEGYQPRRNYQQLLLEVITDRISADSSLRAAVQASVQQPAMARPQVFDINSIVVPAPARERDRSSWMERRMPVRSPRASVNYLEIEARNASLGAAGEELVLKLEHERLWNSGYQTLANRIEHVSRTRGDGLGYDIVSFEASGREKLIEVKTTRFGAMTPFFASRNEVAVSEEQASNFHLYRVFRFDCQPPNLFVLSGSLRQSVLLDPVQYQANLP